MKTSTLVKLTLFLSGTIATGVGAGILMVPHAFHGSAGLSLGDDVSMLNEIRASGGLVLVCGLFVFSGAIVPRLAFPATLMSVAVYLAYGLSRVFSMIVDGMPNNTMLQITAIELAVAALCLITLGKQRTQKQT